MTVAIACHLGASGPASINCVLFPCCSEDLQRDGKLDGLGSGLRAVEGALDIYQLFLYMQIVVISHHKWQLKETSVAKKLLFASVNKELLSPFLLC